MECIEKLAAYSPSSVLLLSWMILLPLMLTSLLFIETSKEESIFIEVLT